MLLCSGFAPKNLLECPPPHKTLKRLLGGVLFDTMPLVQQFDCQRETAVIIHFIGFGWWFFFIRILV